MKNRIKDIRTKLKLSQEEFGKQIGIGKTSISKIETGENKPSEQTIMLICEKFNVSENWLKSGTGEPFISVTPYEKAYNHFGYIMENAAPSKKAALSMLLELLYSVDDQQWDSIMKHFEEIKKES